MQTQPIVNTFMAAAAVAAFSGCSGSPAYYDGFEKLEITSDDLDEDTAHPVVGNFVQTEYWLDYQDPTVEQLAALQAGGTDPVDLIPWIRRGDLEVSEGFVSRADVDSQLLEFAGPIRSAGTRGVHGPDRGRAPDRRLFDPTPRRPVARRREKPVEGSDETSRAAGLPPRGGLLGT